MSNGELKVTAADINKALALRHSKEFFITECKNGQTWYGNQLYKFDAVAIYKSWAHPKIIGYEVKVSRGDYMGDNKFIGYMQYFHEFYLVTPTELIDRLEVPTDAGLIYFNPKTGSLTTKKKAIYRSIEVSADMLMYIIMNRLDEERIPFYSSKAEMFKDWLNCKTSNRTLAGLVRTKLVQENARLDSELNAIQRTVLLSDNIQEKYDAMLKVMRKHDLNTYCPDEVLDKALALICPAWVAGAVTRLKREIDALSEKLKNVESEGEA